MAMIIKPPSPIPEVLRKPAIFLAGSIEMGIAARWQTQFETAFIDSDVILLNPRRDEWDSSWVQSIENLHFREQVEWELAAQERSTIIAMYFDPATKAPITLLELGLFAQSGKVIVCCQEGYWRKGNVDIVCRRYGIPQADTLERLIEMVRTRLR